MKKHKEYRKFYSYFDSPLGFSHEFMQISKSEYIRPRPEIYFAMRKVLSITEGMTFSKEPTTMKLCYHLRGRDENILYYKLDGWSF